MLLLPSIILASSTCLSTVKIIQNIQTATILDTDAGSLKVAALQKHTAESTNMYPNPFHCNTKNDLERQICVNRRNERMDKRTLETEWKQWHNLGAKW